VMMWDGGTCLMLCGCHVMGDHGMGYFQGRWIILEWGGMLDF